MSEFMAGWTRRDPPPSHRGLLYVDDAVAAQVERDLDAAADLADHRARLTDLRVLRAHVTDTDHGPAVLLTDVERLLTRGEVRP